MYMHKWPIVPNHGTLMKKIHPSIMEECTRKDIPMDRQIDELDPFLYSLIPLRQSGEENHMPHNVLNNEYSDFLLC